MHAQRAPLDPRRLVVDLAGALRVLHQRLLAVTQREFEVLYGRVPNAAALLQLAVNDPLFAWLQPVSQLLVSVDELASADDLDPAAVDAARDALARLLDEPSDFRAIYLGHLQADPDVVLAHAEVRRLLPSRLPGP
jgi:hypothetical protein